MVHSLLLDLLYSDLVFACSNYCTEECICCPNEQPCTEACDCKGPMENKSTCQSLFTIIANVESDEEESLMKLEFIG